MTEKRFEWIWSKHYETEVIVDHYESDLEMLPQKSCEVLNSLNDENEQLDNELIIYKRKSILLEKENEQLKQTIDNICKDYEDAHGMDIRNAEWFNEW